MVFVHLDYHAIPHPVYCKHWPWEVLGNVRSQRAAVGRSLASLLLQRPSTSSAASDGFCRSGGLDIGFLMECLRPCSRLQAVSVASVRRMDCQFL